MTETSHSLLDRARQEQGGDAWRRLVEIYSPLLRIWLCRLQLQPADADDLAQEVLLAVSRDLPGFDHSGRTGAFRSWLRKILFNRVQHYWRSCQFRPVAAGGSSWAEHLDQLADDRSSASREWNLEHDRCVMARLLELVRPSFEPQTWEAFRLQVVEGQRADQVARLLQISVNSAYVARSRVLAALRREAAGLVESD